MELSEIENVLQFQLPPRHQQAILNLGDPIHKKCDFHVTREQSEWLDTVGTNVWLHSAEVYDPWPDFLVAFAPNGCGDYFAYDTRQSPATIVYIDPDLPVRENISDSAEDKLRHASFESWYASYFT